MLAHGDTESVNLRTGEQHRRVTGNGESRLESSISRRCVDCDRMTIGVHRKPVTCEDCEQKRRGKLCDDAAIARLAWREWVERREAETTYRRIQDGTPDSLAIDEFMFLEGFKKGPEHALPKRP